MKPLQIAIADDHVLFRKGMISMLELEEDLEVVLEAGNGQELLNRIGSKPVDVVLMDADMPEMDGIEACKRPGALRPEVRVVMLSGHSEEQMILHAIQNGAKGYLLKNTAMEEVIDSLHSVMQNGFCFNENVSHLVLRSVVQKEQFESTFSLVDQLTEREKDVLKLICQELTSSEIGEKLFISPRTVETYRKNLLEKIGARNTVGLVIFAMKHGLVET